MKLDVTVAECPMKIAVGNYGKSKRKSLKLTFVGGYELAEITIDPCDEDGEFSEDMQQSTTEGLLWGDLIAINNRGANVGLLRLLIKQGVVDQVVDEIAIQNVARADMPLLEYPVVSLVA